MKPSAIKRYILPVSKRKLSTMLESCQRQKFNLFISSLHFISLLDLVCYYIDVTCNEPRTQQPKMPQFHCPLCWSIKHILLRIRWCCSRLIGHHFIAAESHYKNVVDSFVQRFQSLTYQGPVWTEKSIFYIAHRNC